jgi:hypothetical protein
VLKFLQQSYTELFAGLAAMIGDNVIVAGVTDMGATYSDGWVVIGGELLPFVGGLKNTDIVVTETIAQSHYGDGADKDAFYTRFAQCAGAGGIAVVAFSRLANVYQYATQAQLTTAINDLVNAAPGALDTLKELADALGDDPNFAATITAAVAAKVNKAGDTMTGPLINTSTAEVRGGIRTSNAGAYLKKIIIAIGAWNMHTTVGVSIAHGLADITKIRGIQVMILSDSGNICPIDKYDQRGAGTIMSGGIVFVTAANVALERDVNGQFEEIFGDFIGGGNRGWITIEYEA